MAHHVTVTGVRGFLRRGYQSAAELSAWTVARTPDGWSLTATIQSSHAFWISQRPLVFEAPHANGAWRWPITELLVAGVSLTAKLGPKES